MRFILILALAVFTAGSFGCAPVNTSFTYTPTPVVDPPATSLVIGVEPLEDVRPPRSYPFLAGRVFLTYVPLLPYIRNRYERIDETYLLARGRDGEMLDMSQHLSYLLSTAIASDLGQSGMFREVRPVFRAQEKETVDYLLGGELVSSAFDLCYSSYYLGAPGVLLWAFGVPNELEKAHLAIRLTLKDREGRVVWSHHLAGSRGKWHSLYYPSDYPAGIWGPAIQRFGRNEEGVPADSVWAYHAVALRRGMAAAKQSLADFLASVPAKSEASLATGGPVLGTDRAN